MRVTIASHDIFKVVSTTPIIIYKYRIQNTNEKAKKQKERKCKIIKI